MDPALLMDMLGLSTGEWQRMALVMARLSGLFLFAPFFSRSVGPARIRVILLFTITLAIFPMVPHWPGEGKAQVTAMAMAILTEGIIGLVMGMLTHWALLSAQTAGNIIGVEIGLSMATVMDPTSGMQEGVVSNLLYLASLMIFLALDGHLLLLQGLINSFKALPPGGGAPSPEKMLQGVLIGVTRMFELGILLAAPVIAVSKLIYVGLALINRASPQIQVFFVATPLTQVAGMLLIGLTMGMYSQSQLAHLEEFMTLAWRLTGK